MEDERDISLDELDICFQDNLASSKAMDNEENSSHRNNTDLSITLEKRTREPSERTINSCEKQEHLKSEKAPLPELKIRPKHHESLDRANVWSVCQSVKVPTYDDQRKVTHDINQRKFLSPIKGGGRHRLSKHDELPHGDNFKPQSNKQKRDTRDSPSRYHLEGDFPGVANKEKKTQFLSLEEEEGFTCVERSRLSAPISPRLLGRHRTEQKYSTPAPPHQQGIRKERSSSLNSPAKQFDTLYDEQPLMGLPKHLQLSHVPRRSLDISFDQTSTRFLSEIHVSLTGKPNEQGNAAFPGEELLDAQHDAGGQASEVSGHKLPNVLSGKRPHKSANRPVHPEEVGHEFGSQSLLGVRHNTNRLSHLSLSPRLPRKSYQL